MFDKDNVLDNSSRFQNFFVFDPGSIRVSESDIFLIGQASLRTFFGVASWTLFFFIPAITMKMIAEEKNAGTLELVLTKSISDRQLVYGKFLASVLLVSIALLSTLPYIITLSSIGNLDTPKEEIDLLYNLKIILVCIVPPLEGSGCNNITIGESSLLLWEYFASILPSGPGINKSTIW